MDIKENSGVDFVTLQNGYRKLNGGPERFHDNMLPSSPNLAETDNGGFLGRTESKVSESSKL